MHPIPAAPGGLDVDFTTEGDLNEAAAREIRNYLYVYAVESAVVGTTVSVAAEVLAVIVVT